MNPEIIDSLRKWNCDVTTALERFLDDEELYKSCLDIFAHDEHFGKLKEALKIKDYKNAFDSAHTLKGVAGELGLTPLYQAIIELVESLRSNNYTNLDAQYAAVDSLYLYFLNLMKE